MKYAFMMRTNLRYSGITEIDHATGDTWVGTLTRQNRSNVSRYGLPSMSDFVLISLRTWGLTTILVIR
jgi:hypothetical protein